MLVRFLLFFAIIYSILRFGGKILKLFLGNQIKKNQEYQRSQNQSNQRHREGQIDIDFIPDNKKNKRDFKGGDYIDYEELD